MAKLVTTQANGQGCSRNQMGYKGLKMIKRYGNSIFLEEVFSILMDRWSFEKG